jgi:hypothetical protein
MILHAPNHRFAGAFDQGLGKIESQTSVLHDGRLEGFYLFFDVKQSAMYGGADAMHNKSELGG